MEKNFGVEGFWQLMRRAAISSYPAWCVAVLVVAISAVVMAASVEAAVAAGREFVALLPRSSFDREVLYQRWRGKKFINGGKRCK